ncbi:MAG: membrane protein insertion efficiency factor YidD [Pseudomonadota bacterium]|nr:MAG: membrane protein insertion efficiency factor YidD [Pseudomonadota bacterium]
MSAERPGIVAQLLLLVIRVYQLLISPLLGPSCRFHPSCSRYTAECVRLHGALRGSYLGARRLLRCHPFHPGGYDPPPPRREKTASE